MPGPELSIIIPVYNESATILEVLARVWAVTLPVSREVIVVDDGSTDGTTELLEARRHGRDDERREIIHCARRNRGKGAAIRAGLSLASGRIIMIQDADLELDPGDHPRLIEPILRGEAEVVYGTRDFSASTGAPLTTRAANIFLSGLTSLLYRTRVRDMETGYKVFLRNALRGIELHARGFEFEPEITAKLLRAGHRIAQVPIGYQPRSRDQGKKIRWSDGLVAVYYLVRYRVTCWPSRHGARRQSDRERTEPWSPHDHATSCR